MFPIRFCKIFIEGALNFRLDRVWFYLETEYISCKVGVIGICLTNVYINVSRRRIFTKPLYITRVHVTV